MDTAEFALGCTVNGRSYFSQSCATFLSSSLSAYRPGSYIRPSDIPAAPCCSACSRISSISFSSCFVSFRFTLPETLARAVQCPASTARLHGILPSIASRKSLTWPFDSLQPLNEKSPPPILSLCGVSSAKPVAASPQFPDTNVVIPCSIKGANYFRGSSRNVNQSL